MSYADKTLTCSDCGQNFEFTAGEQEFYASRGLVNEPRRCPTCRQTRKTQRNGGGEGYSSGHSYDNYGGGYSNGGGHGRSYSGGQRQMYTAICAQCGREAQVPFQPRGDRPVYCSDCYSQQRGR